MSDNTYNGWTNYATWRVNLECFDDAFDPLDYWDDLDSIDAHDLAKRLEQNIEDLLFWEQADGFVNSTKDSYARAFLSDVNYYEIASHMLENIKQESTE